MSAAIQSPTQLAPTQNFAPISPLIKLQRGAKKPDSRLSAVLKERFTHFHGRDKNVFREIINVGQLVNLFFNGKQFPVRNPVDGSWGVLPLTGNTNSDRRALNIMNNIKTNLLGKWENSSPDILIRPGRNLDTCVSAAKAADVINNYYEGQFYNHHFTQQEGLMGMTFGTYIDRYRFDDSKVSMSVIQDIFEQKEATFGDGFGFCGDCQYGGSAKEFEMPPNQEEMGALGGEGPLAAGQVCPQCQSTAVMVEGPAKDSIHSMSRQESKQIGDLVCELLPMPACRWDLAKRPEDSNYFIYSQEIPKGDVIRVMGNVLLPSNDVDDYGLEALRALAKQGAALSGFSNYGNRRSGDDGDGTSKSDTVTFNEMWLSPGCYADVSLIGDEKTVDGGTVPKGKLTDVFPDGLCAVGLNNMALVLALYPEKHKDHIVSGTWFMQAQTGAGRGLADLVEVQKQFNTGNNQAAAYMTSTYSPAIGYDNSLITGNKMKYIGTPKTNIPFDLTKLPEGRTMKDAIFQFQPTAMPNQFFNYFQNFLNVMAQKTSMASDFANGEPGITAQNTTATAAEIDQGNADSINQPIFLIKGDCRKRGAEITINQFRQHFPMKRYFQLTGKHGQEQSISLSGADVDADLVYEIAKNSEMPKGPFTKQKNRMQFFNAVGGVEGLAAGMQQFPKITAATAQDFDVDIDIEDNLEGVNELCLRRMRQMEGAAKAGVTDPNVLITEAIQPPISAVELNLAEQGHWFARFLTTDKGLDAPMPIRAAAEMLARGMIAGQTAQEVEAAAQAGTVQAAGAAPAAVGGAMLEKEAQPEESTEPDPTSLVQMQQEREQQQHEAQESEKDRIHEKEILKVEGERDKQVAKHDADQKIRVEKSKPKPAVKSAGAKK
jgi:hypothetical protein